MSSEIINLKMMVTFDSIFCQSSKNLKHFNTFLFSNNLLR